MQQIIKYILVAGLGAGLIALTSLLWPRFTSKPEPQSLEIVRSAVLGTEIGQNTSDFLGLSQGDITPINLSDAVSSAAGVVTSTVEQKVAQIVSDQVASQVVKQYNQLPVAQQDRVVEMICKPKE